MIKNLSYPLLVLLLSSSMAFAKLTSSEALKKLEGYQDSNVTSSVESALSEAQQKEQDEIFDTLREAVQISIKEPKNEALRKEAVRVASLMLQKDPSAYAAEVILPLYKFNKKTFTQETEALGKEKAKDLIDAIKDAEKELHEGNG